LCAEICDDGDACTIDDTGDCEQDGCPAVRDPVDCDDSDACTTDSCDSSSGCSYDDIECVPDDLCHVAVCDGISGGCMDVPVNCAEGETCDLDTGDCVADGMTCFDLEAFAGTGDTAAAIQQCEDSGCDGGVCTVVLDDPVASECIDDADLGSCANANTQMERDCTRFGTPILLCD
jgi:hypothetical protein